MPVSRLLRLEQAHTGSPAEQVRAQSLLLQQLVEQPGFERESPDVQDRVRETLRFMESLGSWSDEMLRLSPSTLEKVLRMGASVQKFIRGS